MVETFYRWHQRHAPAFTPDNAYSADWGSEFTPDGTKYRPPAGVLYYLCEDCQDEAGACGHEDDGECEHCECPGWTDCERGYSCTWEPGDLIDYIRTHQAGDPADTHGTVYVFEGEHTGDGTDGEPLAVPSRVVRTLTWSQMLAEQQVA